MKNKNIAFLISNIDNAGGTERVSLLLGNYLCKSGYEVSFFSYYAKGHPFFYHDKKIRVIGFESQCWYMRLLSKLYPDKNDRLRFLLRLLRVNVIIDVDMGQSMYSSVAIQGTKCKKITWDHFNYNENRRNESRMKGFECCKQFSSKLVVLTKADMDTYIRNEDLKNGFITQIYNPLTIEEEPFTDRSNNKKVVAIGRLEKQKGFDILLKIWKLVERNYPEWMLEIYGDGSERNNLLALIEDLQLRNVRVRGRTRDVKNVLRDSGIFVLTSRFEGFGLVLVEAEAMGLPIVSFDCPFGPSEIIKDGKNGFLIEPNDMDLFSHKLALLMDDKSLRMNFGKASYLASKRFTIDNIIPKWIELINSI